MSDQPKPQHSILQIQTRPDQKWQWAQASQQDGKKLADWAAQTLNEKAMTDLTRVSPPEEVLTRMREAVPDTLGDFQDIARIILRIYERFREFRDYRKEFIEMLHEAAPEVLSYDFLNRVANGADRNIFPLLLLGPTKGTRLLERLPYALQERYAREPIPTVIFKNGEPAVLEIGVRNLTRELAEQVFAEDHIRDEAEQRAWLESQKTKALIKKSAAKMPYEVRKDKLIVGDVVFTKRELLQIAAAME